VALTRPASTTRRARAAQRALAYMMSSCPLQADKRFHVQFPIVSIPRTYDLARVDAQQTTLRARTCYLIGRISRRFAIRDRSIIRAIDRLRPVSPILYFLVRSLRMRSGRNFSDGKLGKPKRKIRKSETMTVRASKRLLLSLSLSLSLSSSFYALLLQFDHAKCLPGLLFIGK